MLSKSTIDTDTEKAAYMQLFQLSGQLIPSLKVSVVDSPAQAQSATILTFFQNIKQQNPTAGSLYWSHKCWQLLIWQPIFLSIIATYGIRQRFAFHKLIPHYRSSDISGYSIASESSTLKKTGSITEFNASEAAKLIQSLYQQLNLTVKLKPRLCDRLLSDQLLQALSYVPHYLPEIDRLDFSNQVNQWFSHFSLPNRKIQYSENFQIKRISCCLEYKTNHQQMCTNCPKLRKAIHVPT